MKFSPHMIGYGLAVAAVLFVGAAWLRAHDAWIRAQIVSEVQDKVIKQNQDIISRSQEHIGQVTKLENSQVAKLEQKTSRPATTEDVQRVISAILPKVELQPAAAPDGSALLAVPDTQENRNAIVKAQVDFQVCGVRLDACNQRATDFQVIRDAQDAKYAAVVRERDAYRDAAGRGHGFWANLKHDLIVGGISFGVGYALHK